MPFWPIDGAILLFTSNTSVEFHTPLLNLLIFLSEFNRQVLPFWVTYFCHPTCSFIRSVLLLWKRRVLPYSDSTQRQFSFRIYIREVYIYIYNHHHLLSSSSMTLRPMSARTLCSWYGLPSRTDRKREARLRETNWSSRNGGFADGLVTLPRKIK